MIHSYGRWLVLVLALVAISGVWLLSWLSKQTTNGSALCYACPTSQPARLGQRARPLQGQKTRRSSTYPPAGRKERDVLNESSIMDYGPYKCVRGSCIDVCYRAIYYWHSKQQNRGNEASKKCLLSERDAEREINWLSVAGESLVWGPGDAGRYLI